MNRVRTAIVGCGKVAHIHAAALEALPESIFVAVCDQDFARATAFAEKYHVSAYSDVREMVAAESVEAVTICTPHPAHVSSGMPAIQAGAHVLVEKPLAASLTACDALLEAAAAAGVKLGVVSQRRLYPAVQRVRQALDKGSIGRPVLGVVTLLGWRDRAYYESDPWRGKWRTEGGGVLVNQAPHQLDLLQWFMGPIAELFGYWDNFNHPYIEVEDTAAAILRFRSGGLGVITVSNSQQPGIYGKVHIHGSNGASVGVQTDGGAMFVAGLSEVREPPVNDLWTVPGEEQLLAEWQAADRQTFEQLDTTRHYHYLQQQDFLRAILDDREPLVTGDEGRVTVEIFTAIYRSQRDRSPVRFPVVADDSHDDFDGRLPA